MANPGSPKCPQENNLTKKPKTTTMSYPTFKTHFKNGDSYQVMTQAIGQEPLLTTLHPLPAGSRIMGGQEKSQSVIKGGEPGAAPEIGLFPINDWGF
jgi:hypothetical protein